MRREVENKFEKMLPKWGYTLPNNIHQKVIKFVETLPEEIFYDFFEKFENVGKKWGFSQYSPLVYEVVNHIVSDIANCTFKGVENLSVVLELLKSKKIDKIMFVSNHLSYSDANIMATFFAPVFTKYNVEDDFSVVVGPKVFNNSFKAFSSLQFNTLLTAQSHAVATKEATISIREIATATKILMKDIQEKVKMLLVFAEGGRSRSGNLQRFLPGVLRLINSGKNVVILPISVIGGENFLPINSHSLNYADVFLTVGSPVFLNDIKKIFSNNQSKQEIMDFLGKKVAEIHPKERRGFYS